MQCTGKVFLKMFHFVSFDLELKSLRFFVDGQLNASLSSLTEH